MGELLIQVTEPYSIGQVIMYIVAGIVVALGSGAGGAVIQKKRTNGTSASGLYNKPLCDERHRRINQDMTLLFGKIDKMNEILELIHKDVMKN